LVLYGEATGNDTIRDLGVFWHATESEAIRNYWFDADRAVFPDGYGHSCVGMIWGDGGVYGTFWTANPEEIHGINFLPLNGGSLYLGRDPEYVLRNFKNMLESNHSFHTLGFEGDADGIDKWHDILCEYLALADPDGALDLYEATGGAEKGEFGETPLHTRQWLASLQSLGRFDAGNRADHPTAAAFVKGGEKTYVVFNARAATIRVRFSDGTEHDVPPGLHVFRE
jgi:endoglucanase Acf2